jgi:circadian clock protein KaiC
MKTRTPQAGVAKMLTGIQGFDEISNGGLPRERTTLVMVGPGCGKTVLAIQSLETRKLFFLDAHLSPEAVTAGDSDPIGMLKLPAAKAEEIEGHKSRLV